MLQLANYKTGMCALLVKSVKVQDQLDHHTHNCGHVAMSKPFVFLKTFDFDSFDNDDAPTFIMRSPRGKACNCNSSDLEPAPKIMAHNGMHTAGHTVLHPGTV